MVYFVQCRLTGRLKIGKAKDPERRFATLQTGSPTQLVLLGCIPGGRDKERELHQRIPRADRLHGEWFSPSRAALDLVREHGCRPAVFDMEKRYKSIAQQAAEKAETVKRCGLRFQDLQRDYEKWRQVQENFYEMVSRWGELVKRVLWLKGEEPRTYNYKHDHGSNSKATLSISGSLTQDHERAMASLEQVSRPEPDLEQLRTLVEVVG